MMEQILPDEIIHIIADKCINIPNTNLLCGKIVLAVDSNTYIQVLEIKVNDREKYIYITHGMDISDKLTYVSAGIDIVSVRNVDSMLMLKNPRDKLIDLTNISATEMLHQLQNSKKWAQRHLSATRSSLGSWWDDAKAWRCNLLLKYIDTAINIILAEHLLFNDLIKCKMND